MGFAMHYRTIDLVFFVLLICIRKHSRFGDTIEEKVDACSNVLIRELLFTLRNIWLVNPAQFPAQSTFIPTQFAPKIPHN